jgi:NifU-like protein involved in Fe-S cluster formation
MAFAILFDWNTRQMTDDLYAKELLRWAADVSHAGRLDRPDASATQVNAMCGDRVHLDFKLNTDGSVDECRHETRACVLTQGSASMLAANAKSQTLAAMQKLKASVQAMLDGGAAPSGPWDAFKIFEAAAPHKARHTCVLLPLDAAIKALEGEPTN